MDYRQPLLKLDHYGTRTLIQMSINKWIGVMNGARENSRLDCPLCSRFNTDTSIDCEGCPIKRYTGREFCQGTPYSSPYSKSFKRAKDEVTFLRKVLRAYDKWMN